MWFEFKHETSLFQINFCPKKNTFNKFHSCNNLPCPFYLSLPAGLFTHLFTVHLTNFPMSKLTSSYIPGPQTFFSWYLLTYYPKYLGKISVIVTLISEELQEIGSEHPSWEEFCFSCVYMGLFFMPLLYKWKLYNDGWAIINWLNTKVQTQKTLQVKTWKAQIPLGLGSCIYSADFNITIIYR